VKTLEPVSATVDSNTRAARSIRTLTARACPALLEHFLALDDEDRRLRFNQPTRDRTIERYVEGIDFDIDVVFGYFSDPLTLEGVGHLTRLHDDERPHAAEFAVSVSRNARGCGIGTALFACALVRARGMRVQTLWLHFLSHNAAMMHIARKAGMTIQCAYGEADARLAMPPTDDRDAIVTKNRCSGPRGDVHDIAVQHRTAVAPGLR